MLKVPKFTAYKPSSEQASRLKRKNRSSGGQAERMLRRLLWRVGIRYRLHLATLPGKPDMAISRWQVAVFVDGDFWHGRDWDTRRIRISQGSNASYWINKIEYNMERDRENSRLLNEMGWTVIRFWETEVLADPDASVSRILRILNDQHAGKTDSR